MQCDQLPYTPAIMPSLLWQAMPSNCEAKLFSSGILSQQGKGSQYCRKQSSGHWKTPPAENTTCCGHRETKMELSWKHLPFIVLESALQASACDDGGHQPSYTAVDLHITKRTCQVRCVCRYNGNQWWPDWWFEVISTEIMPVPVNLDKGL